MKKELSQEEIDAVFSGNKAETKQEPPPEEVAAFDLSHLDRIPKSQLRALHMVHENFVRNLASSLSAYLRSYVALNLVSLEQISYAEFIEGVSFPTGIAYLGLSPYDGTAVLELFSEKNVTTPVVRIGWPDQFIEHATTQDELRAKYGLSVANTVAKVKAHFGETAATTKQLAVA